MGVLLLLDIQRECDVSIQEISSLIFFFREAVAIKKATNPAYSLAQSLNLPSSSIVSSIHIPNKLIWGRTILGLGDIVQNILLPNAYSSPGVSWSPYKDGSIV